MGRIAQIGKCYENADTFTSLSFESSLQRII